MNERDELMEKWRNYINDAIGSAEGMQDFLSQFIAESTTILRDWGNPYPMSGQLVYFHDYCNTVHDIIQTLHESMKVYREYVELFGGENLIRCDCCSHFKRGTQDYPNEKGQVYHLCPECAEGWYEK